MSKELIATLTASAASSILFFLSFKLGMDFMFLFLPTIPLFSVGMSNHPRVALESALLSALVIAVEVGHPFAPTLYLVIFALPAWWICRCLMLYRDIKIADRMPILRLWYPTGLVMVDLSVFACVILAIVTAIFATQEINFPTYLSKVAEQLIKNVQSDTDMPLQEVSREYMVIMGCWLNVLIWIFGLYAHAWIANRILIYKNMAPRPNIAVHPFPMPNWLLTLMGIAALASLIGGESMRFLGKISLMVLMIPYFFQGLAILHISSIGRRNRLFSLIFIYLSLATMWPIFLVIGLGLWQHVKLLNKLLSTGENSSKS